MQDLLKTLQILGISLVAQIWFTYFNVTFWLSRLKSGVYYVPVFNWTFNHWLTFTFGVWFFNAIFCYIWATPLIGWAYHISLGYSKGLYFGFLLIQVASFLTSVYFMHLIVGETPNRNGWIVILLLLLAIPFTAHSSTNSK